MIEFTFLGTSSGVPTKCRNVSALAIRASGEKSWYLVDCGEGTQHQILHLPYSLVQLSAIFITHVHGDHCYGLPGLLASASMAGRSEPLTIIAPAGVEEFVRTTMRLTDAHMSYSLNFLAVESLVWHNQGSPSAPMLEGMFKCSRFNVRAVALSHRVPSYAYVFDQIPAATALDVEKLHADEVPRGPLWGAIARGEALVLEDGRQLNADDYHLAPKQPLRVIVGGDNDTPQLLQDVAKQAHVLIHEATYTQAVCERVGPAPQHSSAAKVAQFAQQVQLSNLVLTHFSARYHHPDVAKAESILEVHAEAAHHFQGTLFLANDFDHFSLNAEGVLTLQALPFCRGRQDP